MSTSGGTRTWKLAASRDGGRCFDKARLSLSTLGFFQMDGDPSPRGPALTEG